MTTDAENSQASLRKKELYYIHATNLAKLRIASAILRSVIFPNQQSNQSSLKQATKLVDELTDVEEKFIDQE